MYIYKRLSFIFIFIVMFFVSGSLVHASGYFQWIGSAATGKSPMFVALSGNYAYVPNQTSNTMSIVNISNPLYPVTVGSVAIANGPYIVTISGNYAYVSVWNSSAISIYNISNPTSPTLASSITLDSYPAQTAISGNYAYVANNGGNTVSVVNISNPAAPVKGASVTVGSAPTGVVVYGNYVYVTNYTSNTISVLNISNPASPTVVATVTVGTNPELPTINGSYLYVPNYGSNTISVLSLANPAAPSIVATIANQTQTDYVAFKGSYAYSANNGALGVINISNPAAPTVTGSVPGFVTDGMAVSGNYAYCSGANWGTLSVLDVSTPSTPNAVGMVGIGSGANGGGIDYIKFPNKYAYIANYKSNTVSIVDVSNPIEPTTVATVAVGSKPSMIALSPDGNYLYVTNYGGNSISIVNISNPLAPSVVNTVTVGTGPNDTEFYGNYAYVANTTGNTVNVLNISNITSPSIVATLNIGTGTGPFAFDFQGNYAYVTDTNSTTVSVINISNPAAPVLVTAVQAGKYPAWPWIFNGYMYVPDYGTTTVTVLNMANPAAPTISSTITVGSGASDVDIYNAHYMFVGNQNANTISAVDISNPGNPVQLATTAMPPGGWIAGHVGIYEFAPAYNSTIMGTIDISAYANRPPSAPTVSGPSSGITNPPAGNTYTYTISGGTSPDNSTIRYDVDWNGDGVIDEYDPVAPNFIASGGSQTPSHSWAATGTYNVQVWTEDSYGLKSPTTTYPVTIYASSVALLTASTTSYRQGDPADVLTWSSSGATSCTGTGFSTGAGSPTAGTASVTPSATTTYTVTCSNAASTASSSITVNYVPDLPPSNPAISGPNNLTQGQSYTYTFGSSVQSQGDTIQYGVDWTNSGAVQQWLPATSTYITSGASTTGSYAWNATGTVSLKALARDSRGVSSGWSSFSLSIAPACTPVGMCSGGNVVNSCTMALIQTCSYGCNNGACNPTPSPSFATSTSGTHSLTGHLQLFPSLVRKGDLAHVFWNVINVSSCNVSSSATATDTWNTVAAPTGGATTSPILGQTIFTLSCNPLSGSTSTGVYEQQSINLAPIYRER